MICIQISSDDFFDSGMMMLFSKEQGLFMANRILRGFCEGKEIRFYVSEVEEVE